MTSDIEHIAQTPDPESEGAPSAVHVAGHPLHPMLITFPVAFLTAVLGSDIAYALTDDAFWARMSVWLLAGGTTMGLLAGITGAVEVLAVPGIRRRGVSWTHFVAAVMLLSVAFANWMQRIGAPELAVLPWGLYLSALGAALVGFAGWLGGRLVFEHRIGIVTEEDGD
jgi:uncharacterized membrane protein